MRIDIITAVPSLFGNFFNHSVIGKAIEKGIAELHIHDLRDYAEGKYRQIDDAPYGGGAGMILMPKPLALAIDKLKSSRNYDDIVFFLPEGDQLSQKSVNLYSQKKNLLIVCGHYKGIDQRIVDYYATKIISIGDFVVTGGEIPAALFCDAIIRVLPGAIGNEQSALEDSFQDSLLSAPVYTRPPIFKDLKVPEVLLSGNHKKILEWKMAEAERKTKNLRPDLLDPE